MESFGRSRLEGVGYAASPFDVEISLLLKSVFSDCVLRLFHDIKMLYNCVKFCVMYTRGEMVNVYITLVKFKGCLTVHLAHEIT